jgi:DNA primase
LITQQTIQQIVSRIDITEIVGGFVKLKKRGANYLGLCPFHNEKTPSFTVSPVREIYKCFGCGRSGNAISFLMEHEKYSYVEALRWLANKYNVEIEEEQTTPESKLLHQAADSLYIINGFAQKYFSETLFDTEEGRDIGLGYLKERGFREETLRKFQLGYCLEEPDGFARTALSSQYNLEFLQKSGLVLLRDGKAMDNYRGRIIFPVHNQTGKVVGFGARIIRKNDRAPKYINTPENEIYSKSKILYGSWLARQAIGKNDECLLVEGYTDVISLNQAGIENVVASGGTSLTQDQLRLVKKYTNHLTIIYDGDEAGVKAALRGLDLALTEGLNVKLVLIPGNEDPDSYVNKIGTGAFRDFIAENKKDFILFQLEVSLRDAGADTNKKAAVVRQIAETISKINKAEDFTKQQDYIRQCSDLLKIEEAGLHSLVNKFIGEQIARQETRKSGTPGAGGNLQDTPNTEAEDESLRLLSRDEQQEKAIVRTLLEFGLKSWDENRRVADFIFAENLNEDMIDNKRLLRILETYKAWYQQGMEPTEKNFLYQEDQELSSLVVSLLDDPYELSPNWKDHYQGKIFSREELYRQEVVSTLGYLKLRKIKRLIDMNQKDLEKSLTPDDQLVYIQTHQHLKKMERELLETAGTVIVK